MFDTELARLKTDYHKLTDKDQAFALSLLSQQAQRGLSAKQWPWIKKLADRIDAPEASAARHLGDPSALKALFAKAGEKIKFPHLLLHVGGETLKLWVAGDRSRTPGSLSVCGPLRVWVGRVAQDGTWEPGHTKPADYLSSVADLLTELLAHPQETLAKNGKQAGACCYCGIELTDARSVEAGYGPVCAKKWGLAWGRK